MIVRTQAVNRALSWHWQVPAIAALVLVAISFYSYVLFHTAVEFATVIGALGAFVVTWRAYAVSRNHYLMVLGCGYFWIGALDAMHALAHQGMQVLPSIVTANEPTQLRIAARYSEALLLIFAPLFAKRPSRRNVAFALCGTIAIAFFMLIVCGNVPDCFIEGERLTPFRINSEYAIIAILAGAMVHLWRRRADVDARIVSGILIANVLTIGAELSFAQYVSVYGPANLVGHVFKLFAYWMICSTLVDLAFNPLRPKSPPEVGAGKPASSAFRIAVGGAIFVPLVIYATIAWNTYETTMRGAERDVRRSAEIFYRHALNVFQTHGLIAEQVSERLRAMPWDEIGRSESVRDYLRKITDEFPQAQFVSLADGSGVLRAGSQALSDPPVSVADLSHVTALRERDVGAAVGSLARSRVMPA